MGGADVGEGCNPMMPERHPARRAAASAMSKAVCDLQQAGRPLIEYAKAVQMLATSVASIARPPQEVTASTAVDRVLAEEVALDRAEPPVPRSAMDGYALRAADGLQARKIVGTVYAGTPGDPELQPGEAVAVMTGGTVARGADCVVPVEQTSVVDGVLQIDIEPEEGRHVRRAGEMGAAGRVLLRPGRRLAPADLAVIAGCGHDPVRVHVRPRVALLSTGDEVVRWTTQPGPHQVRDSNRLVSRLQLTAMGAERIDEQHVLDNPMALRDALEEAIAENDLVVTIGGVSMGDKDHLPALLPEMGVERLFHGVRVQPGKPVWCGQRDGCWVLGLPGNPVSSFVVLELLGRVLMARLAGDGQSFPRPLARGIASVAARAGKRPRWLPAELLSDADGTHVRPCAERGSGDWTSLAGTEALLCLPAGTSVEPGDPVHYLPL